MNVTNFYDLPQEIIRKIYSYNKIKNDDERYLMLFNLHNNHSKCDKEYSTQFGDYGKVIFFYTHPKLNLIKHFVPNMFIEYIFLNLLKNTYDTIRFFTSEESRLEYEAIRPREQYKQITNSNSSNRNDIQIFCGEQL